MAERRRRRRICQEDRERLIRAFEEQEQDYLVLADTLGIKRSTARGIVSRYLRGNRIDERPRGGRNNVKFDDDMRQCLQEIVDENCTLTITAINSELQHRLPEKPNVHARTIAKHLEGMLYTFKLSRVLPADRNRPDVIDQVTSTLNSSWKWQIFITPYLLTSVASISGLPEIMAAHREETEHIVKSAGKKVATLPSVWPYPLFLVWCTTQ